MKNNPKKNIDSALLKIFQYCLKLCPFAMRGQNVTKLFPRGGDLTDPAEMLITYLAENNEK